MLGVFSFFTFHIILLELRANLTVRRHISVFLLEIFTGVMRREKGGKRGKKKMDERQEEREKEGGELEEMTEEGTDVSTTDIGRRLSGQKFLQN